MQTLKNIVRRAMLVFLYIGGLGYSALLDMAMAVFAMHFLAFYFGVGLEWYHYLLAAPVIGILPDITSTLLQLITEKKVDDAHHEVNWRYPPQFIILIVLFTIGTGAVPYLINNTLAFFAIPLVSILHTISVKLAWFSFVFMILAPLAHIPYLMMIAGMVLGWWLFSPFWGLVIAISFFLHFFHDSCCLDFGLKWPPFNKHQYHFGGRIAIGKKITPLPFKLVHAFKPGDIDRSQYMDAIEWVRMVYLTPTSYSFYELVISVVLILLTGFSFNSFTILMLSLLIAIYILIVATILRVVSTLYQCATGDYFSH
ncbi:MAG: hypothetical protein G01um101470_142 [Parcubacteria group bacterium Gr01-1014_70]|nr:MAG: hypothetical protein G01um101470_142 [Parcubacteria group bacterium Gr01-1014_70]